MYKPRKKNVRIRDHAGNTGRNVAEGTGNTAVVERLRAVVAEQLRAAQAAPEPEPAPGAEALRQLCRAAAMGDAAAVTRLLARVDSNALADGPVDAVAPVRSFPPSSHPSGGHIPSRSPYRRHTILIRRGNPCG